MPGLLPKKLLLLVGWTVVMAFIPGLAATPLAPLVPAVINKLPIRDTSNLGPALPNLPSVPALAQRYDDGRVLCSSIRTRALSPSISRYS